MNSTNVQSTSQEPLSAKAEHSSLLRDTRGLSTVEYIILLVVVVIGCVTVWGEIGTDIEKKLKKARDEIQKLK